MQAMTSALLFESRSIIQFSITGSIFCGFIAILKTWHLHVKRYEDDKLSHPPPDGQRKRCYTVKYVRFGYICILKTSLRPPYVPGSPMCRYCCYGWMLWFIWVQQIFYKYLTIVTSFHAELCFYIIYDSSPCRLGTRNEKKLPYSATISIKIITSVSRECK